MTVGVDPLLDNPSGRPGAAIADAEGAATVMSVGLPLVG